MAFTAPLLRAHQGHLAPKDGGWKDGERAKGTGAWSYEGTTQLRIPSIEATAIRPRVRGQAPERDSRRVYASRRRLRGSLPDVRDDRIRKGQRRRCAACDAVGADGARRAVTLTIRGVGCPVFTNCREVVMP